MVTGYGQYWEFLLMNFPKLTMIHVGDICRSLALLGPSDKAKHCLSALQCSRTVLSFLLAQPSLLTWPLSPTVPCHLVHITFYLLTWDKIWENNNPGRNSRVLLAFLGGHPSLCPQEGLLDQEGLGVLEAQPVLGHPGMEEGNEPTIIMSH